MSCARGERISLLDRLLSVCALKPSGFNFSATGKLPPSRGHSPLRRGDGPFPRPLSRSTFGHTIKSHNVEFYSVPGERVELS